jgi:hypothetical protein
MVEFPIVLAIGCGVVLVVAYVFLSPDTGNANSYSWLPSLPTDPEILGLFLVPAGLGIAFMIWFLFHYPLAP